MMQMDEGMSDPRFNRYIVECKYVFTKTLMVQLAADLIDT